MKRLLILIGLLFFTFTSCNDDIIYTSGNVYISKLHRNDTLYYQVNKINPYGSKCIYRLNVRNTDKMGHFDKIDIIDRCGKFTINDKIILTSSKKQ